MGSSLIWGGWNEVPSASGPLGQTNVGVAARRTVLGFKMVVIAQGLDRAVWLNTTTDDQNWSGWRGYPGGKVAIAAPCITWNGNILVPGSDQCIYTKPSYPDNSPFTILPPETSLPRRVCHGCNTRTMQSAVILSLML